MTSICRSFGTAFLSSVLLTAQAPQLVMRRFPAAAGEKLNGAGLAARDPDGRLRLYTWGDRILSWTIPQSQASVVAEGPVRYPDGGCAADADGDGRDDLVVLEHTPSAGTGTLVWVDADSGARHVIDTGVLFRDCLPTDVDGRRGVLVLHRYAQLRFYEFPKDVSQPWQSRDIYSSYTASKQGGLLRADVDGDGFPDILFGNYWLQAPASGGEDWRLHAVNLWHEEPDSALARLAWIPGSPPRLVVAQSDRRDARLAVFTPPSDSGKLWPETRLEGFLHLRYPRALAVTDLDNDGDPDIIVGEDGGSGSRLLMFENRGGQFAPVSLGTTDGLMALWAVDSAAADGLVLLGASHDAIVWWRAQPRR